MNSIPVGRIIEKLDFYLDRNDTASAKRHLYYWLEEARGESDKRGELAVLDEIMGLERKLGNKNEAQNAADEAMQLISELKMEDTVAAGTIRLNSATVYKAFGDYKKAIALYEQAKTLYDKILDANDSRLGGLYNNMALAYVDAGEYNKANELYNKALNVMQYVENGELDTAITYLNMADAAAAEHGLFEADSFITSCLEKARKNLELPTLPRNGYYAFVCEKCASVFGYYGHFAYEKELKERARSIYEGT